MIIYDMIMIFNPTFQPRQFSHLIHVHNDSVTFTRYCYGQYWVDVIDHRQPLTYIYMGRKY